MNNSTLNALKGQVAEEIVLKVLRQRFQQVTDRRGRCLYDFSYKDIEGKINYADAKARRLDPAQYGKFYSFWEKEEKMQRYKQLVSEKSFPFWLYWVEPESRKIYVGNLDDLYQPCTYGDITFPFNENGKTYFSPKQFREIIPLDENDLRIEKLRELYNLAETIDIGINKNVSQNQLAVPKEIFTAPNGTDIDFCQVADVCQYFVKMARLGSAIGYKDPGITPTFPLMEAASKLDVPVPRFFNQRLSGNPSYNKKGYYLSVGDVPKVLAQYYELHHRTKGKIQVERNKAALDLRLWFMDEVPKLINPYYAFIKEQLDINLPSEFYRLQSPNVNLLQQKPTYLLHEIIDVLYKIQRPFFSHSPEHKFIHDCIHQCYSVFPDMQDVPKITFAGKAVMTNKVQAPNGMEITFFKVGGCQKIFVHGAQLAAATTIMAQGGATSERTVFSKAVASTTQYYDVTPPGKVKSIHCVVADDVSEILNNLAFRQVHRKEDYKKIKAFNEWWLSFDLKIFDTIKTVDAESLTNLSKEELIAIILNQRGAGTTPNKSAKSIQLSLFKETDL